MGPTSLDVFAVGDASVDSYVRVPFIAGPDQKAMGTWLGVFGGGMAANFAAAAAHTGATASLMASIGDDAAGTQLLSELRSHRVDVSASTQHPGMNTFQCFVQLDGSGEKALFGAPPGEKVPRVAQVPLDLIKRSSYLYLLADDLTWAGELAAIAQSLGTAVVVDLERAAVGSLAARALETVGSCDIAFANTRSFMDAGISAPDAVLDLLLEAGATTAV
ncbi:MAG: carbohydrate kinase family protein, partial [Arachnia sp.]